jgi:hypothetical protein
LAKEPKNTAAALYTLLRSLPELTHRASNDALRLISRFAEGCANVSTMGKDSKHTSLSDWAGAEACAWCGDIVCAYCSTRSLACTAQSSHVICGPCRARHSLEACSACAHLFLLCPACRPEFKLRCCPAAIERDAVVGPMCKGIDRCQRCRQATCHECRGRTAIQTACRRCNKKVPACADCVLLGSPGCERGHWVCGNCQPEYQCARCERPVCQVCDPGLIHKACQEAWVAHLRRCHKRLPETAALGPVCQGKRQRAAYNATQ